MFFTWNVLQRPMCGRLSPQCSSVQRWGFWEVTGSWGLWSHQRVNPLMGSNLMGFWERMNTEEVGPSWREWVLGDRYLGAIVCPQPLSLLLFFASWLPREAALFVAFFCHDVLPQCRPKSNLVKWPWTETETGVLDSRPKVLRFHMPGPLTHP
jgi:hypothetical protein